jgi:hypothetical protein
MRGPRERQEGHAQSELGSQHVACGVEQGTWIVTPAAVSSPWLKNPLIGRFARPDRGWNDVLGVRADRGQIRMPRRTLKYVDGPGA